VLKADKCTTILCRCHEIWEQIPGTLWTTLGLQRDCFTFNSVLYWVSFVLIIPNTADPSSRVDLPRMFFCPCVSAGEIANFYTCSERAEEVRRYSWHILGIAANSTVLHSPRFCTTLIHLHYPSCSQQDARPPLGLAGLLLCFLAKVACSCCFAKGRKFQGSFNSFHCWQKVD
jgi:hypothetical protein